MQGRRTIKPALSSERTALLARSPCTAGSSVQLTQLAHAAGSDTVGSWLESPAETGRAGPGSGHEWLLGGAARVGRSRRREQATCAPPPRSAGSARSASGEPL